MLDDPFDFDAAEDDGDTEKVEPDPATIAHLDQQEAAFAAEREKWNRMYGFDHDCHCGQDYSSGKTVEVTQCFTQLVDQALGRCAGATMEIGMLSEMLDKVVRLSNDLINILEELGHTDELKKYFGESVDLDAPAPTQEEELDTTDLDAEFEELILLSEEEDERDDDELEPA